MNDEALETLAKQLGCEARALRAVAQVESNGDGFLPDGKPVIRFEGHIFNRRTNGRFRESNPEVATLDWRNKVKVGRGYPALFHAAKLDEEAAYASCSWGAFQIMGFHHIICGSPTTKAMAEQAKTPEGQLAMFANFIRANPDMQAALQHKDWKRFARAYNGPGQVDEYARRMADAYEAAGQ